MRNAVAESARDGHATRLPQHVGIIPDGNRRWAQGQGFEKQDGYHFGLQPGLELYNECLDRKSTRLNSSHANISYAVFCLNDTATTDIYTLSLHDALPICWALGQGFEKQDGYHFGLQPGLELYNEC